MRVSKQILPLVLVALVLLFAAACSPAGGAGGTVSPTPDAVDRAVPPEPPASSDEPTPTTGIPAPGGGAFLVNEAQIESIDVLILESFPVQVHVVARGYRGACDELDQPVVAREGNTFKIRLTTRTRGGQVCTMQAIAFEQTIPLDVAGLEAGEYIVDVNGVTASFSLETDNVLAEPPAQ